MVLHDSPLAINGANLSPQRDYARANGVRLFHDFQEGIGGDEPHCFAFRLRVRQILPCDIRGKCIQMDDVSVPVLARPVCQEVGDHVIHVGTGAVDTMRNDNEPKCTITCHFRDYCVGCLDGPREGHLVFLAHPLRASQYQRRGEVQDERVRTECR